MICVINDRGSTLVGQGVFPKVRAWALKELSKVFCLPVHSLKQGFALVKESENTTMDFFQESDFVVECKVITQEEVLQLVSYIEVENGA
jgi:hypothetical protein